MVKKTVATLPFLGTSRTSDKSNRGGIQKPKRCELHQPNGLVMDVLSIDLGRGFLATLDAACWEQTFVYHSKFNGSKEFRPCDLRWKAMKNRNYWYAVAKGKSFVACLPLHRLVMNCPKELLVDHRDGNTLNNCLSNLRLVNHSQNAANARKYKNSKAPYRGITQRGDMWQAQLHFGGKGGGVRMLGNYDTPEEAALAWDAAAKEHFGEFARLNFPNGLPAEANSLGPV